MRLIFPGIKIQQNFKIPQLCSSIAHIQLPLQSTRKHKYNFCSLRLCGITTDFQREGCYPDLTLTTTISSLQSKIQYLVDWQRENAVWPWAGACSQKMSCRDTIHASKGGVGTTLRWVYFIKCCLGARSAIIHGETKSSPFISPSSHRLLHPVPPDQRHLASTRFTLSSAPLHDKAQCRCSGRGCRSACRAGKVPCKRHPVPLRCLTKPRAQPLRQLQLG